MKIGANIASLPIRSPGGLLKGERGRSMHENTLKRRLLHIAIVWFVISLAIGGITFAVCGSFQPLICDCQNVNHYTPLQEYLFLFSRLYALPVTTMVMGVGKITPFDIFSSPFLLEVADLKIGPGVVLLYAVFYAAVTLLVDRLISLMVAIWKKHRTSASSRRLDATADA